MTVLCVSVYVGDYLVLTDELDVNWHSTFNCTNATKHECDKCHPGSFANQSNPLLAVVGLLLKLCLYIWFCKIFIY